MHFTFVTNFSFALIDDLIYKCKINFPLEELYDSNYKECLFAIYKQRIMIARKTKNN